MGMTSTIRLDSAEFTNVKEDGHELYFGDMDGNEVVIEIDCWSNVKLLSESLQKAIVAAEARAAECDAIDKANQEWLLKKAESMGGIQKVLEEGRTEELISDHPLCVGSEVAPWVLEVESLTTEWPW